MDDRKSKDLSLVSTQRRRPRIIAHRGANLEAPENTLPAIERALELGADGVEFDLMLTSDKVPVVTHNDDLSMLTHFAGYLHTTPFATVKALDVGSHFSTKFAGTVMPTLAEVLEVISPHDVLTVLDIKAQPGMGTKAALLAGGIVSDMRMRGPIIFASSSLRILGELKKRHRAIPRALTVSIPPFPFFPTGLFAKFNGLSALHPSLRSLWPSLVAKMKGTGLEINAWTPNSPQEFDMCADFGIDGIFTDDVAAALAHFSGT